MPSPNLQYNEDGTPSVLRKKVVYAELNFYKRSDVLYQLTVAFCGRFLPQYGDRTVDQMVQAARSTKQNIVEGSTDGQTSVEVELKLLGIARGSNQELLEDYTDYLKKHAKQEWWNRNPRFEALHAFCKEHTAVEDYQKYFSKWTDEEMANCAICLCHIVDRALETYIRRKDHEFVTEGGIRERMTAARLGYRNNQKEIIDNLTHENEELKKANEGLKRANEELKKEIVRLQSIIRSLGGTPG